MKQGQSFLEPNKNNRFWKLERNKNDSFQKLELNKNKSFGNWNETRKNNNLPIVRHKA